ncbi:MAG: leucyl aminopeptidase [Candidatus Tectomicrobia bacterium]|nr:leucyl aminopeptidase [Candidatus Tectomicrobia bacterium]
MEIHAVVGSLATQRAAAIGLGLFADGGVVSGEAAELDARSGGLIRGVLERGDFSGKEGEELVLYLPPAARAGRAILIGLGKAEGFTLEKVREASARLAAAAARLKVPQLALSIPGRQRLIAGIGEAAQAAVEGMLLGTYGFRELKTKAEENGAAHLTARLLWQDGDTLPTFERGLEAGRKIAAAVCFARDLVARPSNLLTPTTLAECARQVAAAHGLRCTVLEKPQLQELGFGALLGVARGSAEPPTLSILEYRGGEPEAAPIVVIGKGITFDSGGISLKTAENMERMKYDMAGAAATLAILKAVASLGLRLNIVGLLPATENLPGATAYKPGDILRSLSGKTIEVVNTDAEGRLILADALAYAQRFSPAAMIDLATLTGACRIAVGPLAIAMMGNHRALRERCEAAAALSGERVWHLPLWDEYFELIKSDVADVKNSGGAPAGTITAGLFLRQFVGEVPWLHLDIASTAWVDEARPYVPKGPSGAGVRLVAQLLRTWAAHPAAAVQALRAGV